MERAIVEAGAAAAHDDVPIGAVVVRDGTVIAARHNERELTGDPTAHAEILALRDAASVVGHWRLDDCTMVVTLEPCAMCAGALVNGRIERLVYGAPDPKAGAAGSLMSIVEDPPAQPPDAGGRRCRGGALRAAARGRSSPLAGAARATASLAATEGCQSGRMGRPRKPLRSSGLRGFESHSFRQQGFRRYRK